MPPQDVGELVANAGVGPLQALPFVAAAADPFADLGTRKAGRDWPSFLGPTADSVSTEKGILTKWPEAGLRVLWHKKVGTGYGPVAVSKGRLFVFDRIEDRARLRCLKSESGELLWKFEYGTAYTDHYGYNNGPRCAPVVDHDRVYIYGAEGMLHCVREGKPVWKVDTVADFGVVQNFFGVRRRAGCRGRSPPRAGRRLAQGRAPRSRPEKQRHGPRRLRQAHRQGEVQSR